MSRLVLQLDVGGDPVRIGEEISVSVVRTHGRQVHLLFEAPREVRIDREEIWRARRAAKGRRPS